MNIKTLKLIEDITENTGIWSSLEFHFDLIYLEFNKVQLYDDENFLSELILRFGDISFFKIHYNDIKDVSNLNIALNKEDVFFREFEFKLKKKEFKFQDIEYTKDLENKYSHNYFLLKNNENYDFILSFNLDKFAVTIASNTLNFFNNFEILNENTIKKLSNKWCVRYLTSDSFDISTDKYF